MASNLLDKENMQPGSRPRKAGQHKGGTVAAAKLWHSAGKGYEIMERILKPLVGVFDDVMQELHDSRVPDVGREEEDAFMSKAVQYIRQYILSDRVTMKYLTEKEALTGLVTALCAGELDVDQHCTMGRKRSFVTSLILSTSPFITVLEKSFDILDVLIAGYDQRMLDVDDTLCHNVARVLTSLIESKNSVTGIFAYAKQHREIIAQKFIEAISCDAMLFIYLEMVGASEERRVEELEEYCRDFAIMDTLLTMLATTTTNCVIKNLLEAIVTVSSCLADKLPSHPTLISGAAIKKLTQAATATGNPANNTVCRLAALTHLAILDTQNVTAAVAEQLSAVRMLLQNAPGAYCEDRKHCIYERPVGSIRIATIELLVAFIDKSRDSVVEPTIPQLIEEAMLFFAANTTNDFVGIEMVQLVRRVLASNLPQRILHGLLTQRSLEAIHAAIESISNIWQLGHMRCIVADILAKYDDDAAVRAHLQSFPQWERLHSTMCAVKDGKITNSRHKRQRHTRNIGDCALPVSPLSVLAAGELHKTLCNGVVVHEDTPRKVMYVTQTTERVPTPVHGQGHAKDSPCSPRKTVPKPDEESLSRELF
eukprot:COSAG01_NODE_4152_length_5292_cov_39.741190_4_plen_595_part_00